MLLVDLEQRLLEYFGLGLCTPHTHGAVARLVRWGISCGVLGPKEGQSSGWDGCDLPYACCATLYAATMQHRPSLTLCSAVCPADLLLLLLTSLPTPSTSASVPARRDRLVALTTPRLERWGNRCCTPAAPDGQTTLDEDANMLQRRSEQPGQRKSYRSNTLGVAYSLCVVTALINETSTSDHHLQGNQISHLQGNQISHRLPGRYTDHTSQRATSLLAKLLTAVAAATDPRVSPTAQPASASSKVPNLPASANADECMEQGR